MNGMSYECLLQKYQEATETIRNMEIFIKKYVEESQEEARMVELENDFKRSCSLLHEQANVIKRLKNSNKILREKVVSLTKESSLLDSNFPEQIEDIKKGFMQRQNELEELKSQNVSLKTALEETTKERDDLAAKVARLSEAQVGQKVELDVGPAVSEFSSPAEYRIAELEKTVAYLTEELDKETAKLSECARRERALKEDHRRTWMELRRANEKLEELMNLKQPK